MKARILVVDDDAALSEMIGIILASEDFEPVYCYDGSSAREVFRASDPDLILLDVMMPGLSGLDVLRQIRATERLSSVKVLLLTARARDTDVDDGYSTGADEYVTKPFSPRELLHRVNSLLGRGR